MSRLLPLLLCLSLPALAAPWETLAPGVNDDNTRYWALPNVLGVVAPVQEGPSP